jgi:hypothetical protein
MIETKNVLATEMTKSFAAVLTCHAGESQLDDMVDFFKEQELTYAKKSDDFEWLGCLYLDVFSTADSKECQFDSLLPAVHHTEELAIEYAKTMIEESDCVSKRFFSITVCDADKIDSTLKNSPFTPGEWI